MNKNTTILLTGGSGHIGGHLKNYFESRGASVIAPTRVECDLSVNGATTEYLESLLRAGTNLDYVICNAANQSVQTLDVLTPASASSMMQSNFISILEIYAFIKKLSLPVKSVLTISSIEAISPRGGHLLYGASKAAVEAITKSAPLEIPHCRSNALRLGLISRPGIESSWPEGVTAWKASTPLSRMGELTDVSNAADFLLHAEWITGEVLTLDGGNSVNPGW
jgi:NAD(P)-dependent dehydrogenase (short-subunit alcohol dehydrogenase family)